MKVNDDYNIMLHILPFLIRIIFDVVWYQGYTDTWLCVFLAIIQICLWEKVDNRKQNIVGFKVLVRYIQSTFEHIYNRI